MKTNYIIIAIAIVSVLLTVPIIINSRNDVKEYKEKLKTFKLKYDILEAESTVILDSITHYKKLIIISELKNDSLNTELTNLNTKRHEVPNNVDDYTPSKLDSILTAYEHPRED